MLAVTEKGSTCLQLLKVRARDLRLALAREGRGISKCSHADSSQILIKVIRQASLTEKKPGWGVDEAVV